MPAKVGIQNLLKILDSPVSSTGQAHRRASLEYNPAYAGRNDKNGDCDTVWDAWGASALPPRHPLKAKWYESLGRE